jgi:hypothetical protein
VSSVEIFSHVRCKSIVDRKSDSKMNCRQNQFRGGQQPPKKQKYGTNNSNQSRGGHSQNSSNQNYFKKSMLDDPWKQSIVSMVNSNVSDHQLMHESKVDHSAREILMRRQYSATVPAQSNSVEFRPPPPTLPPPVAPLAVIPAGEIAVDDPDSIDI